MNRLLVIVVAALAFPASAAAKELKAVTLCGPSGCATSSAPEDVGPLQVTIASNQLREVAAPRTQAYYRVELNVGGNVPWAQWYVPGADVYADRNEIGVPVWWDAKRLAVFRTLASRVKPFAAPTLTKVLVDGRRVADPSAYLAVLGPLAATVQPTDDGTWIEIALTPSRPSPWLEETTPILFRPRSSTVFLSEPRRATLSLANTIRADAGLPALATGDDGLDPVAWGVLLGWIPIVIVLGLLWMRRRGRPSAAHA